MHASTMMTKAELAKQLGVSRTYITLLAQGKRKLSQQLVDKLDSFNMTSNPLGGTKMSSVGSTPIRPRQKICLTTSSSLVEKFQLALKSTPISYSYNSV